MSLSILEFIDYEKGDSKVQFFRQAVHDFYEVSVSKNAITSELEAINKQAKNGLQLRFSKNGLVWFGKGWYGLVWFGMALLV